MRRVRIWWLLGAAAIALAAFAPMVWPWPLLDRVKPQGFNGLPTLEQGAEFIRTLVFDPDGHRRSVVGDIDPEWVGLTAGQFIEWFPEWDLVSFAAQRVVVEESCDELPPGGFIRKEKDAIVIFEGDPAGCHWQQETVDIHPDEIFQVVELEAGIRFTDSFELELILEGLHGP